MSSHVNQFLIPNYLFQYVRGGSSDRGIAPARTEGKLQEQPFQLLVALLERPGQVVTREELRSKLWPADTFVDFDHGLNAAIKRLRDALGESAERPIFVETLARRGYRFIAPVDGCSGSVQIAAAPPLALPRPWQWLFTTRNAVLGGLTACVLALSFLYYSHSRRPKADEPSVTPAVTNVGEKFTPSLSPDGQHLAFAWNGGAGIPFSLYVKVVGAEESLRLTKQTSIDFNPVWSPDGRHIAFCRIQRGETGVYVVPAFGGTERRVRRTLWEEQESYEAFWSAGRLSRGHPMGSHSRFLTVHPLTNLLFLSFCYRSIRWKSANSVRPWVRRRISIGRPLPTGKPWPSSVCVRGVISILHSPPMVKHWPFPEFRTESSRSTQCRFREEKSNVLSLAVHTTGVWRGRRTVATSFSLRLVGSQRTVRFGRYPCAGVSQNDCSLVKGESNL